MTLARTMWFGTKQYSRWIKVHSPGSEPTPVGYSDRIEFTNGGVGLRESTNSHMEYPLVWNRVNDDQAAAIVDFANGIYGDKPYYLLDPAAMRRNVLNKAWSAPGMAAKDAVPIAGTKRPEVVANLDQSQGYPVEMAKYTLTATDTARKFYVPIPPGHTAQVGAHGDTASTLRLRVQPTVRGIATGAASNLAVLANSTPNRFNGTFAGGDQAGIEISIATGAAGSITLSGIMVRVVPTGTTGGETGRFISGLGAGGLEFEGRVGATPYSIAHNSYGLAVKLVETEDWL